MAQSLWPVAVSSSKRNKQGKVGKLTYKPISCYCIYVTVAWGLHDDLEETEKYLLVKYTGQHDCSRRSGVTCMQLVPVVCDLLVADFPRNAWQSGF